MVSLMFLLAFTTIVVARSPDTIDTTTKASSETQAMNFIHEINKTFLNGNPQQATNRFDQILDNLYHGNQKKPLRDRKEEVLEHVKKGNPEAPLGVSDNLEDCEYLRNHGPSNMVVVMKNDPYGISLDKGKCAVFWTSRFSS